MRYNLPAMRFTTLFMAGLVPAFMIAGFDLLSTEFLAPRFESSPLAFGAMFLGGAIGPAVVSWILLGIVTFRRHVNSRVLWLPLLFGVLVWPVFLAVYWYKQYGPREPLAAAAGTPVVLVVIDTLRADDLEAVDTPNIDSLAADSIVFTDAVSSAPWTLPAMASIMTGVSPLAHGVGLEVADAPLPTLAQILRDNGYASTAVVGNHLLGTHRQEVIGGFGPVDIFSAGFDRHVDYDIYPFGSGKFARTMAARDPRRYFGGGATSHIISSAIPELSDGKKFLWVHVFDPHHPYAPLGFEDAWIRVKYAEEEFDTLSMKRANELRALYRAEILNVDFEVGKLLDAIKKAGIYDKAVIVLTSDHGEGFLDHGTFRHGSSLHQELLSVPLIVKLPDEPPTTWEGIETTASIPATILQAVGVEPPAHMAPPLQSDRTAVVALANFSAILQPASTPMLSVTTEQWKYIVQGEQELVYDRVADPFEMRAAFDPAIAKEALEILESERTSADKLRAGYGLDGKDAPNQRQLDLLRSLGYL